jgi:hypothetical protein
MLYITEQITNVSHKFMTTTTRTAALYFLSFIEFRNVDSSFTILLPSTTDSLTP